jgi:hypothetical protein
LKENTFPFKGTCLAREGEYDGILFDFLIKRMSIMGLIELIMIELG